MEMRCARGGGRAARGRAGTLLLSLLLAALVVPLAAGCGAAGGAAVARDQLVVATTTSLSDSGLLDEVVLPLYRAAHPGVTVKVVAVGSGEAMAMGARGEADVLLVHSPADEAAFMAAGHGTLRLPFAYNYFAVVGPADDPAGIRTAGDAVSAFRAIARLRAPFVSRGDGSGTNQRELALWRQAGVSPSGRWYVRTGQGMGETLQVASEKQAYTLADLGTFLAQRQSLDLRVLLAGSGDLRNVYDVIIVNQNEWPTVNAAAAEQLAQVLVGRAGQRAIAAYGREKYGQPLFRPCAPATAPD